MKRLFALFLCCAFVHVMLAADAFALASPPAPSRKAVKVAAALSKLGAGEDSIVAVRLRDKTLVKGRLSILERQSFVITDLESKGDQRVFYSAVDRMQGVNVATGEQVQVGVGFKAKLASVAGFLFHGPRVQKNSLTETEKWALIGVGIGLVLAIILARAL